MMKKITSWRKSLKLWSVQAAILGALVMVQGALPFWEGIVDKQVFMVIGAVINTGVWVLRNIRQKNVDID